MNFFLYHFVVYYIYASTHRTFRTIQRWRVRYRHYAFGIGAESTPAQEPGITGSSPGSLAAHTEHPDLFPELHHHRHLLGKSPAADTNPKHHAPPHPLGKHLGLVFRDTYSVCDDCRKREPFPSARRLDLFPYFARRIAELQHASLLHPPKLRRETHPDEAKHGWTALLCPGSYGIVLLHMDSVPDACHSPALLLPPQKQHPFISINVHFSEIVL
jgi:hypothetical protein